MPLKKSSPLLPGMVIMLHAIDGCYTPSEGWNPQSKASVPVIIAERRKKEKYSDNLLSSSNWQTIAEHTNAVVKTLSQILAALNLDISYHKYLLESARWHDAGKAHPHSSHDKRRRCQKKSRTILWQSA